MSQENYVALLGTKGGPAIRPGSTMPTSSLLALGGRQIVVDCGLGVTKGLVDQGMQLRDLDMIFITHLHSDHYLELGPLVHTAWTAGLKSNVDIWGPEGLEKYWNNFLISMEADIDLRVNDEGRPNLRELVRIHVIDAGTVIEKLELKVQAIRTVHPPLVDCFALSFESAGKCVVFSGDTAYMPALAEFAKCADLLIHEAMLESALPALLARVGNGSEKLMEHWLRSHTFAADAARLATDAEVAQLAFNHLSRRTTPLIPKSTGMTRLHHTGWHILRWE